MATTTKNIAKLFLYRVQYFTDIINQNALMYVPRSLNKCLKKNLDLRF